MMISQFVFFILGVVLCLFGLVYLLRGKLMPYHEQYLECTQDQIPLKWRMLASQSVRLIGSFKLGIGLSILLIDYFFFQKNVYLVKVVFSVLLVPPLVALIIASDTVGHKVPRIAVVILWILFALGIIISC